MKKNQSVKKGFTLIELIVVIAILGILAAVLLPKFSGFTDNARKKSAMSEAKSCYSAVAAYYSENGEYPSDAKTLSSLSADLITGVGTITKDAKGDAVLFTYKSVNDKISGNSVTIEVSENGKLKDITKS